MALKLYNIVQLKEYVKDYEPSKVKEYPSFYYHYRVFVNWNPVDV